MESTSQLLWSESVQTLSAPISPACIPFYRHRHKRSSSLTRRSAKPCGGAGGSGTCGAPISIHCLNRSTSPGSIGLTLASTSRRRGGISPSRMRLSIRLSCGVPTTIAGPDLPPLRMASRELRSSSPSCFRGPWQTVHRRRRMGRMSCCVTSRRVGVTRQASMPGERHHGDA